MNQKQLADELRAYADSISEAEWNKVYDGTYSKSTIRARNFAEAFGQMGLGYAHFLGKDRFDLITASGGRNNDLTKEERASMKDKAKKVAAEIRRDSEPDLRNWANTPGTKKYNDSVHKMSSSEINAAVKKSLESGIFDMEFLERNLDLDQYGNPLKESELKKSYAKFLKEEYGE